MAAKRRRQSTRLENLGIPEEELLRQQQELFARARAEQEAQQQQVSRSCTTSSSIHCKALFCTPDQVELSRNVANPLKFNLVAQACKHWFNFSQYNLLTDVGLATKASRGQGGTRGGKTGGGPRGEKDQERERMRHSLPANLITCADPFGIMCE